MQMAQMIQMQMAQMNFNNNNNPYQMVQNPNTYQPNMYGIIFKTEINPFNRY